MLVPNRSRAGRWLRARCRHWQNGLPGFGSSAKPADFDYSISGYCDWLAAFVDTLGFERFSLVVHDWGGGVGLAFAQRVPERIERLVVHTCVPLLDGYRWHWVARVWRTPLLGEVFMAMSTKPAFRLYRSAPPSELVRAGRRLQEVRRPALILWPTDDPYVGVRFGQQYADALGGDVELEIIDRAGHWMWLDRPDVIEKAAAFLTATA